MNKIERAKIRKHLMKIIEISQTKEITLNVSIINAIIDIDEGIHSYKANVINKTRNSGRLNEFGKLK